MKSLFTAALALACTSCVFAQSEKEADKAPGNLFQVGIYGSPFQDRVARREGDLVTVLISENSSSTYTANTALTKVDSNSISNGIPLLKGLFSSASTGANSSNVGTGTTLNTGVLTAQMACIVKKALPNGNLVIEGTRQIKTNKDVQTFKLTGIIRQDDIQSGNTITSAQIHDFNIQVEGKGQMADRQRRGFLTRALDWLF
jgi:flagellar L-ring protein precursor FlgH